MLKKRLTRLIPRSFFIMGSKVRLNKIPKQSYNTDRLGKVSRLNLDAIFASEVYQQEFDVIEKATGLLAVPDEAGGVNRGDRRAIYSLVRYLQPKSVLEIGTHIGVSTVCIASALRTAQWVEAETDTSYHLVTVDNREVNDPVSKPWQKFGAQHAPLEMLKKLRCDDFVEFITSDSLDYFSKRGKKYDFVFLDGSHASSMVYQEVPAAMKVLHPDGYILLHDYFPNLRPLWSNRAVVPGPYLATRRLEAEGADIEVLPLGRLPWPTKLNSTMTSLALLGRKSIVYAMAIMERVL
jgi:predicted O-methyltransferase YrrM